jgi:1-acyl-sn-glycerol-3-phosphate acyltransferase
MEFRRIAHTLAARTLLILFFIIFAIPFALIIFTPMKYRLQSKFISVLIYFFCWGALKCTLLPIKYEGLENIPDEPVIFAANHQSSLDIPLVGKLAGYTPQLWLATTYLLQSPLLRLWVPRMAIMVDTSSPQQAMRSLISTIRMVEDKKCHVIIFPEGQRYSDDHVHDFLGGFVILAKKLNRPVVPVCIIGANKVYPRDTFWANWQEIRVVVGPPIYYSAQDTDETYKQRVYQWFVDLVGAA